MNTPSAEFGLDQRYCSGEKIALLRYSVRPEKSHAFAIATKTKAVANRVSIAPPPFCRTACYAELHPDILHVNVCSGVHVVQQVPARMIGVLVDNEFVATGRPAPVGNEGPIPRGDFKSEPTSEPESVRTGVKPDHTKLVSRSNVCEVSMRERMVKVKPRVVARRVSVPVIPIHVLTVVVAPIRPVFHFRRYVRLASWRWRRCMSAITRVLVLRVQRHRSGEDKGRSKAQSLFHEYLPSCFFLFLADLFFKSFGRRRPYIDPCTPTHGKIVRKDPVR
jgi:hypothetical protein